MEYYKKLEKLISITNDLNDIINIAKNHYKLLNFKEFTNIINMVIYKRKCFPDNYIFSLKLAVNLAVLFGSMTIDNGFICKVRKKDLKLEESIFINFINRVYDLYVHEQTKMSKEIESVSFKAYMTYHFDFSSISISQYLKLFKLFDTVSNKVYGFSIYKLVPFILFLTSDEQVDMFTNERRITNQVITRKDLKRYVDENNLPEEIISKLFLDRSQCKGVFPTDITKLLRGKIGISSKKNYLVPQTHFILEYVLKELFQNEYSKDKKGYLLEEYVKELLVSFFKNEKVYHSIYDENGSENDFLIVGNNLLASIECKAQDFHEVFRDRNKAEKRLRNRFSSVIKKARKQCNRIENYINSNETSVFYDSDDRNTRKQIFSIKNNQVERLVKIVITLDDYLNLAESSQNFLDEDYSDVWVVNIFSLEKILWACNYDVNKFKDYVVYRTSGIDTISSIFSDELAHFGYYNSPNFNMIPPNNTGVHIHLMNNFTKLFDYYDIETLEIELKKLGEDKLNIKFIL
ncbi:MULTISPECIES: nuclease-related domain-containing protein [Bacillus]|uniref:nuclease-related domain-containing protein n=1 Tax=Bacillus TaxID=1386 RepID=UPI001E51F5B0|nr:nuclease-related domain-containing protein [Bacillus sp. LBG-1-113]MCC2929871.1 NERD domain-containing protein [Bacillus sp. LBG-1-113]